MKRPFHRVTALAVALVLVAVSLGTLGVHSHSGTSDQSCMLCQAIHLTGSLATLPSLSRPARQVAVVVPSETQRTFHSLPPSLSYRGPPLSSTS